MNDKYSIGDLVKVPQNNIITFPTNLGYELYSPSEIRAYENFIRPLNNTFQNTNELKNISDEIINTFKITENAILSGCKLSTVTISSNVYIIMSNGIFKYDNITYSIFPSMNVAARQLEMLGNLKTQNGLERIVIELNDDETFKASVFSASGERKYTANTGIELVNKIITTDALFSGKTIDLLSVSIQPVFKYSGTGSLYVYFDGTVLKSATASTTGLQFGYYNGTSIISSNRNEWLGLTNDAIKDYSIENKKFVRITSGNGIIKGKNPSGTDIIDLTREQASEYLKTVYYDDLGTVQKIEGSKDFTNITKVSNATDSGSTITGALVVSGGVGIGKQLRVAGATNISSNLTVNGNASVGAALTITGNTAINSATSSTSISTGALTVKGGTGIGENLNVGGTFYVVGNAALTKNTNVGGTLVVTGATSLTTVSTSGKATLASLEVTGATTLNTINASSNATVGGTLGVSGITTISNITDSTATTNGALVVSGGTGIAKQLRVGGATTLGETLYVSGATTLHAFLNVDAGTSINSDTGSTSTTTGALVVKGGTGIAENLNVGGNVGISGTLDVAQGFKINTNKFIVYYSTGNTNIAGTLDVADTFRINSNKFAVASATGNTSISGTLGVSGATSLSSLSTSGNTAVGGTLTVSGNTTLSTVSTSGKATINNATIGTNTSISATGDISTSRQFTSTVASGTAPFVITSPTVVANLNSQIFNGNKIDNTINNNTNLTNSTIQIICATAGSPTNLVKAKLNDLPVATTTDNGIMSADRVQEIERLKDAAGFTIGSGINLIGSVNGLKTTSGGGDVTIYGNHITVSNTGTDYYKTNKISDAIQSLHSRVLYRENQLPAAAITTGDAYKVISVNPDDSGSFFTKINDNHIDTTVSKVAPRAIAETTSGKFPLAFWNANKNGLLYNSGIMVDTQNKWLIANNVGTVSSIKFKKDISNFDDSALRILNDVKIVNYHYIDNDEDDKVGFIAEYTHPLLSTKSQDKMDTSNSIGLLIKAVQELTEQNASLKAEIESLKARIN